MLQEIVEYVKNAINDRLKTVEDAAVLDEAEMVIPDTLDYIS